MATVPTFTVEVEFTAGAWTDVTTEVVWQAGVRKRVGRSDWLTDARPGWLGLSFHNESGDWSPDNPLGSRFPNVVEGKQIRLKVTRTPTTWTRFLGRITKISAPRLDRGERVVDVEALDPLGDLEARTLRAEWAEQWAYRAKTESCECYPLDDPSAASEFNNLTGSGTLKIAQAGGIGGWEVTQSPGQGFMLPGAVTLQPNDSGVGPVLAWDLGRTLGSGVLSVALKTAQTCTATSGDYWLARGYDANGAGLWTLKLAYNAGHTDLQLGDERAVTAAVIAAGIDGDDAWHGWSIYASGGNSTSWLDNTTGLNYTGLNAALTRYVVVGGNCATWRTLGKQTNCAPGSFGALACSTSTTTDLLNYLRPLATTNAWFRCTELVERFGGLTFSYSGGANPSVCRTPTAGRSILDCLLQTAGTIGGLVYYSASAGLVYALFPDAARPITSSLTIAMEADDHAGTPMQLLRDTDARPTRVTVSCPSGSKTAVDFTAEAAGRYREDTWDSCAGSTDAAASIAGARLNRAVGARIPQVALDLVTATTDRYTAAMGLYPGARVTLTGLPSDVVGRTQLDTYALGWAEEYAVAGGVTQAVMVFDLQGADAPPEARLDDATYGRIALGDGVGTVTGGTAVGTTSTGTIVVTSTTGTAFTEASSQYPLDLDWHGECVRVTVDPASTASPQTLTLSHRGLNGTVARAHATGEPIDVWMAACLAQI